MPTPRPRSARSTRSGSLATVFRREDLFRALPLVGDDNRQREYYLNDVFPILMGKGEQVAAIAVDTGGVMGLELPRRAGGGDARRPRADQRRPHGERA